MIMLNRHNFMFKDRNPGELKATLSLALAAITLIVYLQVSWHEYLLYDDPSFVFQNPHVSSGLTFANVKWAFTTLNGGTSYYHPLTWLSHQLDCQLFGLRAGAHHLTNLWLHIANTLLLFIALDRLTGKIWRSAFVAALFAFHPLHIETVAWISERKTLLCTFFWFLSLIAYQGYVRRPTLVSYLQVIVCCAAALFSKPIAVTLPLALLLLDVWPLGRIRLPHTFPWMHSPTEASTVGCGKPAGKIAVFADKLPLIALAAVVSWLTILAQRDLGAMVSLKDSPFGPRLENAAVAYLIYIRKTFWPSDLAVVYSVHLDWRPWQVLGSALFLLLITVAFARMLLSRPWLLIGWLWYLGTLFPAIGLVQVGGAELADRYTYISLVGIFVLLVWSVAEWYESCSRSRSLLIPGVASAFVLCAASTAMQLPHWKNSVRLFSHASKVMQNNYLAEYELALAYNAHDNWAEAKSHLERSIEIRPASYLAQMSLGEVLFEIGDIPGALQRFEISLKIKPNNAETHAAMANLFENSSDPKLKDPKRAVEHALKACEFSRYHRRDFLVLLSGTYVINRQPAEAAAAAQRAMDLSISPGEIEDTQSLLRTIRKLNGPVQNGHSAL